jgi:2,3-bisphosphoglycerate-independent phosphoglycerate mutase
MTAADLKPVLLLILDGWGLSSQTENNAIELAATPTWHKLWNEYPHTRLVTNGTAVGLIEGQMGNSEVGHLNLGAGRIVYQDLPLIRRMIESGELDAHPRLNSFLRACSRGSSVLHCVGLFSDGGVHSHIDHLRGLIDIARRRGVKRIHIHALLDGRDTPPRQAEQYFRLVADKMHAGTGFATLGGRYFGMDRDRRWVRTMQAWEAIVHGDGLKAPDWEAAMRNARERKENDEFVTPTVLGEYDGMHDGEYVLFFNFRADRMRQMVSAFLFDDFDGFDRGRVPMTRVFSVRRYRDDFQNDVLLEEDIVPETITELLSGSGLRVYKSAETEKYAHVTYFFNGGRELPWPGEDRVLVQSPMVGTYDQKPEMSVYEVTDRLVQHLKARDHQLFVVNFANGDMVGHTGIREAILAAVHAVDHCLEQIMGATHWGRDVSVIVTADHGNAEEMTFPDGSVSTQHSMNEVPLVLVDEPRRELKQPDKDEYGRLWSLCDVAPTIMALLKQTQPESWNGQSLLEPPATTQQ